MRLHACMQVRDAVSVSAGHVLAHLVYESPMFVKVPNTRLLGTVETPTRVNVKEEAEDRL